MDDFFHLPTCHPLPPLANPAEFARNCQLPGSSFLRNCHQHYAHPLLTGDNLKLVAQLDQLQREYSTLLSSVRLLLNTDRAHPPSTAINPYPGPSTIPTLFTINPPAVLPESSSADPEPSSSTLQKRPNIGEVIPGFVASTFTSCEYDVTAPMVLHVFISLLGTAGILSSNLHSVGRVSKGWFLQKCSGDITDSQSLANGGSRTHHENSFFAKHQSQSKCEK